jgi:hypothetical protein
VHTSENIADVESRQFNDNIEWMFNENIFKTHIIYIGNGTCIVNAQTNICVFVIFTK